MATIDKHLVFRRLERPLEVKGQLFVAFDSIRDRCRQEVKIDTAEMFQLLSAKIADGSALCVVGVYDDSQATIRTLHLLESNTNEWTGTTFASITLAWSSIRIPMEAYHRLIAVLCVCAKGKGLAKVVFNSSRSHKAFGRIAYKLGFTGTETVVFEKGV